MFPAPYSSQPWCQLKLVCSVYLVLSFLLIVMIVTTGVVHLPRLNNYRECVYTKRLRACTCVQHPKTKAVVIGRFRFCSRYLSGSLIYN